MTLNDLLLLAGILLLIMMLLRMQLSRRRRRSRAGKIEKAAAALPSSTTGGKLPPLADTKEPAEVRLYDSFREMNARLDTKIHILNELIIEAEAKIGELRELSAGAVKPARPPFDPIRAADLDLNPHHLHPPTTKASHADSAPLRVEPPLPMFEPLAVPPSAQHTDSVIADEPLVIDMDARPARPVSQPTASPLIQPQPQRTPVEPPSPFADIYELADHGLSTVEISERLDKPVGEVDLILGLRKRRQQAGRNR